MGKVSLERVETSYEYAKKVKNEGMSLSKAVKGIVDTTDMNDASAKILMQSIIQILDGEDYTWSISAKGTRHLLECISRDFDEEATKKAVKVVRRHMRHKRHDKKGSFSKVEAMLYTFEKEHKMTK